MANFTPNQLNRIKQNALEFMNAVESDPTLYKEAKEKMANSINVMVPETLKMVGVTAAVAAGANILGDIYGETKDAINKSRHYKKMIEENPEMKELNPQEIRKAFSTLHTFNPHYAADPTVAAQFVKRQVETQGADFGLLSNVVSANKGLQHLNSPNFLSYMSNPANLMGLVQYEHISQAAKAQDAALNKAEHAADRVHLLQDRKDKAMDLAAQRARAQELHLKNVQMAADKAMTAELARRNKELLLESNRAHAKEVAKRDAHFNKGIGIP